MGVTGFKNATAEQLEHWADAILEAPTLEAVLAEHFKKCRTLKKTVCQKNKPPYRLHQPTFNRAHPGCGSHSRPGFTQHAYRNTQKMTTRRQTANDDTIF
jgi:hypothetical protein